MRILSLALVLFFAVAAASHTALAQCCSPVNGDNSSSNSSSSSSGDNSNSGSGNR